MLEVVPERLVVGLEDRAVLVLYEGLGFEVKVRAMCYRKALET